MRATSRSTQRVVAGLLFTAAGAVGLAQPVHADAVPGLTATVTTAASAASAGNNVQVTATFMPTTDAGPIDVSIDVLGTNNDAHLTLVASSPELVGCSTSGVAVACTWDEQVADGPQTLVITITVGEPATVDTSWTVRAVAALHQTAGASLAEAGLAITAPPLVATTTPAPPSAPQTTVVETTTTAPATTVAPIDDVATSVVAATVPAAPAVTSIERVEVPANVAAAAVEPTARTDADDDALPTTGTDVDRSVRLAIAAVVAGCGMLVLARRGQIGKTSR